MKMLVVTLIVTLLQLSAYQFFDLVNTTSSNLTSLNSSNLFPSDNSSSSFSLDHLFINSSFTFFNDSFNQHDSSNSSNLGLTLFNLVSSQLNCSLDQFPCSINSKLECLSLRFNCDGVSHCDNGTDELHCGQEVCGPNQFRCHGNSSPQCISKDSYCDGMWDCDNGSDEDHCYFASCQHGLYRCTDQSRCLPFNKICDGKYDCRDHSDELDCRKLILSLITIKDNQISTNVEVKSGQNELTHQLMEQVNEMKKMVTIN